MIYHDIKISLKRRLNDTYFKGYFGNEESLLYYRSDFLAIPGFAKAPAIQVEFTKVSDLEGKMRIQFRISIPVLIIFVLAIVMFWAFYISIS